MSSGYYACFSLSMDSNDVEKLKLKSYDNFLNLLDDYGISLYGYAACTTLDYDMEFKGMLNKSEEDKQLEEKRIKDLHNAYNEFKEDFQEETNIIINLEFHDSEENGNECDDINGYYYNLEFESLYELSNSAEKLSKIFDINHETRFVSGYSSLSIIYVTKEDIERLNLKSFTSLINKLDEYKVDLDILAKSYDDGEDIEIDESVLLEKDPSGENDDEVRMKISSELHELLLIFIAEFKEKTNLSINLSHHDSEADGERYDDIDGHYFSLNFFEVYDETQYAKKLKEKTKFEFSSFITYG